MTKSRVANAMLLDVPWDGSELASPLTLPGALIAPSYIEHTQIATPSNPPAGKMRLYPKADGKYYSLNSAGTEAELGGAGAAYTHPDPFTIGTVTVTNSLTAANLTVGTKATLASPDINGNVRFMSDQAHDIGANGAYRPRDVHVGQYVYVGSAVKGMPALQLDSSGSSVIISNNESAKWEFNSGGHLLPWNSGVSDLGSATARIRNLYLYSYTDQRQISTPANPPAGSVRIYPKTDGKLYMLSSTGVETEIGTGAGGGGGGSVPDPLILENGLFVNDLVMMENLEFITVPGPRIRGNMSASPNNGRLMFENSVINSGSFLGVKPNGTGTLGGLVVYSNSDTANSPYGTIWSDSDKVVVGSGASGTGVTLPLVLYSNGERWRISTTGHLFAQDDNTYDIGAVTSGRPKDLHLAGRDRKSTRLNSSHRL